MHRRLPRLACLGILAFALLVAHQGTREAHASGPGAQQTHVVQPGDTLSAIAVRFGTTASALAQANGIANPALIYVGQRLVVPSGPPLASPSPPVSRIDHPAAARPMHAMLIGHSVLGRPLHVQCTGSGETVVLLVGGIHTGHEANTVALVAGLLSATRSGELALPEGIWLCFLPAVNPDGLALGIHSNAHRVDLNRNWPSTSWRADAFHPVRGATSGGWTPLSEPETRALHDFIVQAQPALVISWHCCATVVDANALPAATALGRRYAEASGLTYIDHWTHYEVTGDLVGALGEMGIPAFDVELPTAAVQPLAPHRAAVEAVLADLAAR